MPLTLSGVKMWPRGTLQLQRKYSVTKAGMTETAANRPLLKGVSLGVWCPQDVEEFYGCPAWRNEKPQKIPICLMRVLAKINYLAYQWQEKLPSTIFFGRFIQFYGRAYLVFDRKGSRRSATSQRHLASPSTV